MGRRSRMGMEMILPMAEIMCRETAQERTGCKDREERQDKRLYAETGADGAARLRKLKPGRMKKNEYTIYRSVYWAGGQSAKTWHRMGRDGWRRTTTLKPARAEEGEATGIWNGRWVDSASPLQLGRGKSRPRMRATNKRMAERQHVAPLREGRPSANGATNQRIWEIGGCKG